AEIIDAFDASCQVEAPDGEQAAPAGRDLVAQVEGVDAGEAPVCDVEGVIVGGFDDFMGAGGRVDQFQLDDRAVGVFVRVDHFAAGERSGHGVFGPGEVASFDRFDRF